MLILFDIDGTILRSGGIGLRAMTNAIRDVHDAEITFDGIDFAGNLDPLIYRDGLQAFDLPYTDDHHEQFRARYGHHLAALIETENPVYALPGVDTLIDALARRDDVTLALLTGNYPETGRLKIAGAGLDPDVFLFGAYGCDGPTRIDLPPVALARHEAHRGEPIEPQRTLIIGDTRHDIACAQAHNCRSLAVATGYVDRDELLTHGPDHAVDDLTDTDALLDWILSPLDVTIS